MSPGVRSAVATLVFAAAAVSNQLRGAREAQELQARAVPPSALMAEARAGLARSARPDLYPPGARLGFRAVGDLSQGQAEVVMQALRAALAPALLTPDPGAGRVVVFFASPDYAARYEAEGGVQLLDRLSPHVGVYQPTRK